MFCRNCGKELIGALETCPSCGARPLIGSSFCPACGAKTSPTAELCGECGAELGVKPAGDYISDKSRLVVTLLAWYFGPLGIHRFYLGKNKTGVLMLLTFGGLGIWAIIDFIIAVSGNMKDKEGKIIKIW